MSGDARPRVAPFARHAVCHNADMPRSDHELARQFLGGDELLSTDEVGRLMHVDPKTVSRWAFAGRFPDTPDGKPGAIQTLGGGEWRLRASIVKGLLDGTLAPREVK